LKTKKTTHAKPVARKPAATRPVTTRPAATSTAPVTVLQLFVAGATERSRQAILRAREFCDGQMDGNCELEVVDIYQQPKLARENQIIATPTLIKKFPPPMRRFIGNLLDLKGLYLELNLVQKSDVAL